MISSAIWDKSARVNFSKTNKSHSPRPTKFFNHVNTYIKVALVFSQSESSKIVPRAYAFDSHRGAKIHSWQIFWSGVQNVCRGVR